MPIRLRPKDRRLTPWLIVLLGAVASGCAGGEPVTAEALARAKTKWNQAGVRDYDLDWTSTGPRNNRFAVAVRGGRVKTVEGIAPDGRRFPVRPVETKYYSIDGLFLTIADELAELDQPAPFNQPRGTKAVLRFDPDPRYGYPRRYRRDVLGASTGLAIDVVRFNPIAIEAETETETRKENSSADDAEKRR